MKERVFTDNNGNELIVQHRKSAVFFLKKYNDEDLQKHPKGGIYIDGAGLYCCYWFTEEEFNTLHEYLVQIAEKSWKDFNPRVADSLGSEYDDYYDKEFDNNGGLSIGENSIRIEGPYAQPPNKNHITRLIKFNKRKFESFIYDLNKKVKESM